MPADKPVVVNTALNAATYTHASALVTSHLFNNGYNAQLSAAAVDNGTATDQANAGAGNTWTQISRTSQGNALQVVAGPINGLAITPSAAFDTAHAAATALTANIWMYVPVGERANRDGLIGRGRRALNEGGWALSQSWNTGGTGGLWAEYAVTGTDMGSSTYAEFNTADLVVEGVWQMYTLVIDWSLPRNDIFRLYINGVVNAPTNYVGPTPEPTDFANMTNGDIEVGTRIGYYDGQANDSDNRLFREASVTLAALTQDEISALYSNGVGDTPVNVGLTPDIYVPLSPNSNESGGLTTALVGTALLVTPTVATQFNGTNFRDADFHRVGLTAASSTAVFEGDSGGGATGDAFLLYSLEFLFNVGDASNPTTGTFYSNATAYYINATWTATGNISFTVRESDGPNTAVEATIPAAGTDVHLIVAITTATTFEVWVNGVSQGTGTCTSTATAAAFTSGAWNTANAVIDNYLFQHYSRAVTSAEVALSSAEPYAPSGALLALTALVGTGNEVSTTTVDLDAQLTTVIAGAGAESSSSTVTLTRSAVLAAVGAATSTASVNLARGIAIDALGAATSTTTGDLAVATATTITSSVADVSTVDAALRRGSTIAATGVAASTTTVDLDVSTDAGSGLVTDGLVHQYDAGSVVTSTGNSVATWASEVGTLIMTPLNGDPQVVPAGLGGQDYVALDGVDDRLGAASTGDLPVAAAARTVIMLVRYNSVGIGGFSWGQPAWNRAYGVVVSRFDGEHMIQGWGPPNDYDTADSVVGTGWHLQSVVYTGTTFEHFRDGTVIDTQTHTYNTHPAGWLRVGSEINDGNFVAMDLAEVLVYDRALTATERAASEAYLSTKYGLSGPAPPIAVAATGTEVSTATADLAVEGVIALSAVVAETSTATADLAVEGVTALSAAAAEASTTTADLAVEGLTALSATAAEASTATADLGVEGLTALSAVAAEVSTATADLAIEGLTSITATAAEVSTAVTDLRVEGLTSLDATSVEASSVTADLRRGITVLSVGAETSAISAVFGRSPNIVAVGAETSTLAAQLSRVFSLTQTSAEISSVFADLRTATPAPPGVPPRAPIVEDTGDVSSVLIEGSAV